MPSAIDVGLAHRRRRGRRRRSPRGSVVARLAETREHVRLAARRLGASARLLGARVRAPASGLRAPRLRRRQLRLRRRPTPAPAACLAARAVSSADLGRRGRRASARSVARSTIGAALAACGGLRVDEQRCHRGEAAGSGSGSVDEAGATCDVGHDLGLGRAHHASRRFQADDAGRQASAPTCASVRGLGACVAGRPPATTSIRRAARADASRATPRSSARADRRRRRARRRDRRWQSLPRARSALRPPTRTARCRATARATATRGSPDAASAAVLRSRSPRPTAGGRRTAPGTVGRRASGRSPASGRRSRAERCRRRDRDGPARPRTAARRDSPAIPAGATSASASRPAPSTYSVTMTRPVGPTDEALRVERAVADVLAAFVQSRDRGRDLPQHAQRADQIEPDGMGVDDLQHVGEAQPFEMIRDDGQRRGLPGGAIDLADPRERGMAEVAQAALTLAQRRLRRAPTRPVAAAAAASRDGHQTSCRTRAPGIRTRRRRERPSQEIWVGAHS